MWDGGDFNGTKIALVCAGAVVAYLRDEKEGIAFPGIWDLPGGGREGGESPIACALREVEEEFGLRLGEDRVTSLHRHEGAAAGASPSYFCVAPITPEEISRIRFGSEGQSWLLMDAAEFVAREDAVPQLRSRLAEHLGGGAARS